MMKGVTRASLIALLLAERVRPDAYAIDGSIPDEWLCLLPVSGDWTVFYSERGGRTGERMYETEDAACDAMAMSLLADRGNRLPAGE
jgi:hypothetical protein